MKLSYQKRFNPITGTVTTQTVSMNKYQYQNFIDELFSLHETDKWNELTNYEQMFIQSTIISKGNKHFVNLTQKDFFAKLYNLHLKNRNTCLLVL